MLQMVIHLVSHIKYYFLRNPGIYVLFKKQYNFKNLPENFIETISNDRTCISSLIEYYDEFGKRKRRDIVEKEIKEKCNILKNWVEQLPKER